MILIHTALQCEAQSIIEKYKLKKTHSNPKLYANQNLLVLIGGVGKENTFFSLDYIFQEYTIDKAINIGIAGASNKTIPIGDIYSATNSIDFIPYKKLKTVDNEISHNDLKEDLLVDMEGEYFLSCSLKYLSHSSIFIVKIVSDHLDKLKLSKDDIKRIISLHHKSISKLIETAKK
jgi:hypothetical protein